MLSTPAQPSRPPQPPQQPSTTSKIEVTLDADLMNKLKTKADAANKTPSEVVAEILREHLK